MFNYKLIIRILGLLLTLEGLAMASLIPFSCMNGENCWDTFAISGGITLFVGGVMALLFRRASKDVGKREACLIAVLSLIFLSLFGALPFLFSGHFFSATDAIFETVSGFTTTGVSIITDLDSLPRSLILWRSLIQWLGGIGFAVFPMLVIIVFSVSSNQLLSFDSSGAAPSKTSPKLKETAQNLLMFYILVTMLLAGLLYFAGMRSFDAVNHAFTTISSGGFSTHLQGISVYNSPIIEYITILFMFAGGMNLLLAYYLFSFRWTKVWRSQEFRTYLFLILIISAVIAVHLVLRWGYGVETAVRGALFQIVSIVSTTGFASTHYSESIPLFGAVSFILMFFGACIGSVGGGIKIGRIIILFRNVMAELRNALHPNAIIPVRIDDRTVSTEFISGIILFAVMYIFTFIIGTVVISFIGLDFSTALCSVASALGNIGPGYGAIGNAESFSHFPDAAKWLLGWLMICGRLEIIGVFVIFSARFWRP